MVSDWALLQRAIQPRVRLHAETEGDHLCRNAPCPCGSGRKVKRCCIDKPTT